MLHNRLSGLRLVTRDLTLMVAVVGFLSACSGTFAMARQTPSFPDDMQSINPRIARPFDIDSERVTANGIRKVEGEHLILYTDVRERPDIDELPNVFQEAVAQWSRHFAVEEEKTRHWKMRAFVMESEERFRKAGLMPGELPPFPAGFQYGRDMWVYVQPGDYYTRHLLLHEGTHAFMEWFLDGWGSPWYSEGMAEKLALHQWSESEDKKVQRLKLNVRISDKLRVPYWGRVNLVHKDLEKENGLTFNQVINLPVTAFRDVRYYGWAWAACEYLSQHELSRDLFPEFNRHVAAGTARFDAQVLSALRPHHAVLARDWELFIRELDYGIDVTKASLRPAEKQIDTKGVPRYLLRADHGWQTTSIEVEKGDHFRIRSSSRFQVGSSEKKGQVIPWISSANGITLEYYQGRPLGTLLVGTVDLKATDPAGQIEGLETSVAVGQDGLFAAIRSGVFCLRINDSPAKMNDNQGVLEVTIEKVK